MEPSPLPISLTKKKCISVPTPIDSQQTQGCLFFVRTKLLMQFQIQEMPNSFAVALSSIAMATCQARRRRDQVTLRYVHMSSKVSPNEISEIGNVREESIDTLAHLSHVTSVTNNKLINLFFWAGSMDSIGLLLLIAYVAS